MFTLTGSVVQWCSLVSSLVKQSLISLMLDNVLKKKSGVSINFNATASLYGVVYQSLKFDCFIHLNDVSLPTLCCSMDRLCPIVTAHSQLALAFFYEKLECLQLSLLSSMIHRCRT